MPAIRTKEPIKSINANPNPPANRVKAEAYLTYNYPSLSLFEDFTSGVGHKTRWYAVLKDQSTIYFEKGSQQYGTLLEVQHPAFKGEWFSSAFIAAKALSEFLETGHR